MVKPDQLRLAIIGDSALDLFIRETPERFARYNSPLTIDQIIEQYHRVEEGDVRTSIARRLGGPILTVGQYLAGRDESSHSSLPFQVSAVTILGTDDFSLKYREAIKNLGIELDEERMFEGDIAQCAYVYNEEDPTKCISIWEGRVADTFKDIEINKHFLARQDILVLPITEPTIAKRAVELYKEVNSEGIVVYNPGPYLQDPRFFGQKELFESIIKHTNILVVNRIERRILYKKMDLTIPNLFRHCDNLDVILSTRDRFGSLVFYRHPRDTKTILHSKERPTKDLYIENPTGAGDAFLGTFLRFYLGRKYDIKDAHGRARTSAERQLTQNGAVDTGIVESGDLPIYDEDFGRLRIAK